MKSAEISTPVEEKAPQTAPALGLESAQPTAEFIPRLEPSTKLDDAQKIVKKNMYWAMGLGIIPVPIVDVLAVGGFQAKAIKELSDLYEIPFNNHKVKNVIAILVSGLSTPLFALGVFGTVMKLIPGLGTLAGLTSTPIVAAAITYAMGQVFIQHFESGGTFLDFHPQTVKEYFSEKIREGMKIAQETAAKTADPVVAAEANASKKTTN